MKKILLIVFSLIAFLPFRSAANHYAGAELTYKWLHDSTYHFTYKVYRDCAGLKATGSSPNVVPPPTLPLCYHSLCDSNTLLQGTLFEDNILPDGRANCSPVSTGCGGVPTQCDNPGNPRSGQLDGYQECWYEGDVTIPYKCSKWIFSVWANSRNTGAISNLNTSGNTNIYSEATLNNLIAQGNSSVDFTVKPVPFVCINQQYVYNNGAVDIDNDSLGYALVAPRSATSECGKPSNIPFATAAPSFPPYNLTTNPLADNNTFTLSPTSGQLQFTPDLVGQYVVALQVTEYRNHIAISTTTRDIQIFVLANCSIQPPPFTADSVNISGGYVNNGTIQNCANVPLHFCFNSKATNPAAVLVVSDNHLQAAPASQLTYTGQGTSFVTGCFSWTPSNADTGLKILTVTIKDSTCTAGISLAETYSIPIYVNPNIAASPDTSICLGNSANLRAVGSNSFTWSVLPGGSPISSLSCTNCANPIATPSVTTRYIVTSNIVTSTSCNSVDTVTVTINSIPIKPTPTSNSPVCANDSLRLYAGAIASSYLWTGPGGFNSVSQNPVIYNIQTPNTGWYHVKAMNGGCVSAPDSTYVTVTAAPKYPEITGNSPICTGSTLMLSAQSNLGVNYQWSGPNGFISTQQNITINSAGPSNAGLYSVVAFYPANAACKSPTGTYNMVVTPGVIAGFSFSKDTICKGDIVYISYIANGDSALSFNYNGGVAQDTVLTNPMPVKFPSAGTETITLYAYDTGCTAIITHNIHVLAPPPATFTAPPVCFGMPVTVIANNVYDADVTFTWNFGQATVLSGSGQGPYILQYGQPGVYPITLVTKNPTCTSPLVANDVVVDAIPDATITTSNINNICSEDTIRFDAPIGYGYHYQWQQPLFFANDTLPSTYAFVKYAERLYLTVIDNYGCKASDSVDIAPHPCCIVSLPNAFTPNGDGKNDVFRIITIGHHDIAYFRVFNRWGQLVFSSTNESQGWDGKANGGVPSDGGTYYYALRYRCVDGEYFEQKGEVVLVR